MLTTADVIAELKRLLIVFPSNRRGDPSALAEVYRSALQGIDPTALHAAVDRCIQEDQFFPKVARLREAASDYVKRHPSRFAPVIQASWDTCGICGAKALPRQIQQKDGTFTESRSLYMDHDPRLHHVKNEEQAPEMPKRSGTVKTRY